MFVAAPITKEFSTIYLHFQSWLPYKLYLKAAKKLQNVGPGREYIKIVFIYRWFCMTCLRTVVLNIQWWNNTVFANKFEKKTFCKNGQRALTFFPFLEFSLCSGNVGTIFWETIWKFCWVIDKEILPEIQVLHQGVHGSAKKGYYPHELILGYEVCQMKGTLVGGVSELTFWEFNHCAFGPKGRFQNLTRQ